MDGCTGERRMNRQMHEGGTDESSDARGWDGSMDGYTRERRMNGRMHEGGTDEETDARGRDG
eukprot:5901900-Pleurochrysis_carterae.AAC.1